MLIHRPRKQYVYQNSNYEIGIPVKNFFGKPISTADCDKSWIVTIAFMLFISERIKIFVGTTAKQSNTDMSDSDSCAANCSVDFSKNSSRKK